MRAFTVKQPDVKPLMNVLFNETAFDAFEVRGVTINHLFKTEIDGVKQNVPENGAKCFASWAELKKYVMFIIKGKDKPKYMKIIFSAPRELLANLSANAAAAFLNMEYENDGIRFLAAFSQKEFSLDRGPEQVWDEYARNFFKVNNISVDEES